VPEALSARVGIAIEPHDDFVQTSSVVPILSQLPDSCVGAIWDLGNAHSAGEDAETGAKNLAGRISYVQVKDGVGQHAQWRLGNVGEGDVPLRRAFELLHAQNYRGAFSIEWEYTWHPELEPPARALPHALQVTRSLLQETYGIGELRA
jgi:sugar phosphate isomerase/epimerase